MILTNELKGVIAKRGMSQSRVAQHLGITPKTFYSKMKCGVFSNLEIQSMIELLKINDPVAIFFAPVVTYQATIELAPKGGAHL